MSPFAAEKMPELLRAKESGKSFSTTGCAPNQLKRRVLPLRTLNYGGRTTFGGIHRITMNLPSPPGSSTIHRPGVSVAFDQSMSRHPRRRRTRRSRSSWCRRVRSTERYTTITGIKNKIKPQMLTSGTKCEHILIALLSRRALGASGTEKAHDADTNRTSLIGVTERSVDPSDSLPGYVSRPRLRPKSPSGSAGGTRILIFSRRHRPALHHC